MTKKHDPEYETTIRTAGNEKVLFLLNKFTGVAPYSHEFQLGGLDPQLLSGFVGAMGSFLGEFAGSEESTWKTAYGTDSTFIVEVGKWVVGVLAVSRETTRLRSQLRTIVKEFEQTFGALKDADGLEGRVFEQFDQFVRRVFTEDMITTKSLVYHRRRFREDLFVSLETPMKSYQLTKTLLILWDGASVEEISKHTGFPVQDTIDVLSCAYWQNMVHVRYIPNDDDILCLSEGALATILDPKNPLQISITTRRLLAELDGRTRLRALLSLKSETNKERVLTEIGSLISSGHVTRIPIEQKLLFVNECILTNFVCACSELLDRECVVNHFVSTITVGVSSHPWLLRVRIEDDLRVVCDIGSSMNPIELDWATESLEYIEESLLDRVSHLSTEKDARELLLSAKKHCQEEWISELYDGLF